MMITFMRGLFVGFVLLSLMASSRLKQDEEVIVFPAYAHAGSGKSVLLKFHAWIFEPEPDSAWRKTLLRALKSRFPGPLPVDEDRRLQRRLKAFIVDNERNKGLDLSLGRQDLQGGRSGSDGHVQQDWSLILTERDRADLEAGRLSLSWDRAGQQKVMWIPREGLSIVSDIDDTIKISQVLIHKALLAHTFLKEFEPVSGMPELYQKLQAGSAAQFHYVSASPWQLYPELATFIEKHYPPGTMSLRKLRWKDASGLEFLTSDSAAYKTATIVDLLQRFPERRFLLVGDAGEKDPEIYEAVQKRFPKQVVGILIRIPPERADLVRKPGIEYFREPAETHEALRRWGLLGS